MALAGCNPLVPDIEIAENDPALSRDRQGILLYGGNRFSGYLVARYPEGTIKSRSAYLDGMQELESIGYYPTGEILFTRHYVRGEKNGEHLGFFPDGSLRFQYFFETGKGVGNHREWYENGQLAKDLNYVAGQPFGPQKMWRPDGKIRSNYVIREDGRRYGLVGLKRCKNMDTEKEEIAPLTSAIYEN